MRGRAPAAVPFSLPSLTTGRPPRPWGNGGYKMIVVSPGTLQEAVDLTYKAFELAERDRNPVMILADGCIGAMMEPVTLPGDEERRAA